MGLLLFLVVNYEMNVFVLIGLRDLHIHVVIDVFLSTGLIV